MPIIIAPEFLQKHPWLGVLIGLAGAIMAVCLAGVFWVEYGRYGGVEAPQKVTVETATLSGESDKMWVTLQGGVWHLDRTIQVEKTSRGHTRIAEVQIPVTDENRTKLIVVKFDGEPDPADVADRWVTGILTHEGDRVWGGSVEAAVKDFGDFETVLVLCVGASPKKALMFAVGGTAFLLVAGGLGGYFGKVWIRQRREAEQAAADALRYGPR